MHCGTQKAELLRLLKEKVTKPVPTIIYHNQTNSPKRFVEDVSALSLQSPKDLKSYFVDQMFVISFEVITKQHTIVALVGTGASGGLIYFNDGVYCLIRQTYQAYQHFLVYQILPNYNSTF